MDEKKKLKLIFMVWRLINWGLIAFLVIRAASALTWLLPTEPKNAVRILVAIAIIAYSAINVFSWANQTQKDPQRLAGGIRLTLLAAAVILVCRILRYIGVLTGILMVPANFWGCVIGYSLLAGALCVSLDKEKQMTDAKMGKVRTPPKKKHTKGKFGDFDFDVEEWTG